MRISRILPIVAVAALWWGSLVAAPVTPKRAAMVAQNFYASLSGTKTGSPLASHPTVWKWDGIYLFEGAEGGFVLVAADDAARPILGYSPSGRIDLTNMPPALQQWLQSYQLEIDALREAKGTAAHEEWHSLEQGCAPKGAPMEGVEPLLTTFWDQTYPYNGYCPGNTVTGCAATAQAQVMNYWKFPAFGEGSHSYTLRTYGVQQADFAHTLYDWAHMPAMATYNSTIEEKEAVATLMYHCGVSLEMAYGTAASGGSSALGLVGEPGYASIDNSLKDYFGYSPSMRVVHKDYGFTSEEWRDLLIADLDKGQPIVYAGSAEQGGHGFVCDGYDSRGYMHFNFGWSGSGDGYFPVDSISPGVGGVGGNVTYTFNMNNSALLGLVPNYGMRVSEKLFSVARSGGEDSLLFGVNDTVDAPWSVECDADWVTLSYDHFDRAGWIAFSVDENNSGVDRLALVTFTQGGQQCQVRVVQSGYEEEDLCPVTVVMECTHGETWQEGAYLSFESPQGFLFGTSRLDRGTLDSVQVMVAPHDVHVVWHKGGGTDRYINYTIKNRHGEVLVRVRNAYRNGGDHLVVWPCAHVGIDEMPESGAGEVDLYPNPTTDMLNIKVEGFQKAELMDMSGRSIATTTEPRIDMSRLSAGAYFVRVVTSSNAVVKRVVRK